MAFRIPFNKPCIVGPELTYVSQAIANGHASGNGPFSKRAQKLMEERFGARRTLLTTSCTAALEMAALLCDLEPGDEVILPSYTFVSTANSVVLRGAKPVFVDIRADTLNIDERLIEAAVTSRTRAIFPVHYAGIACDMDEIMAIAARHNLLVVEDAAQGVFAKYKEQWLGTIGDMGCYWRNLLGLLSPVGIPARLLWRTHQSKKSRPAGHEPTGTVGDRELVCLNVMGRRSHEVLPASL